MKSIIGGNDEEQPVIQTKELKLMIVSYSFCITIMMPLYSPFCRFVYEDTNMMIFPILVLTVIILRVLVVLTLLLGLHYESYNVLRLGLLLCVFLSCLQTGLGIAGCLHFWAKGNLFVNIVFVILALSVLSICCDCLAVGPYLYTIWPNDSDSYPGGPRPYVQKIS